MLSENRAASGISRDHPAGRKTMTLRTSLRYTAASALAMAVITGVAGAQELEFTDAERTPLACDRQLTVDDLASWEVPTANEPYTIAISVPSFANPYIQALIYGAEQAAAEAGVTITVGAGRGFMDPASADHPVRECDDPAAGCIFDQPCRSPRALPSPSRMRSRTACLWSRWEPCRRRRRRSRSFRTTTAKALPLPRRWPR